MTDDILPLAWSWALLEERFVVVALEGYSDDGEREVGFNVWSLGSRGWEESESTVVLPWIADRWVGIVGGNEVAWLQGGARISISDSQAVDVVLGAAGSAVKNGTFKSGDGEEAIGWYHQAEPFVLVVDAERSGAIQLTDVDGKVCSEVLRRAGEDVWR